MCVCPLDKDLNGENCNSGKVWLTPKVELTLLIVFNVDQNEFNFEYGLCFMYHWHAHVEWSRQV